MTSESNLITLLKTMQPKLNDGDFVFCTTDDLSMINLKDIIMFFKEGESNTIIIEKEIAEVLNLDFSFIAAWITLTVHSSLEAVGLTAVFSNALADNGISCNVVAAYYHDHIFVKKEDAGKAMEVLIKLSM